MGYILITGGNLKNKGAQSMIFVTVDEMRKRFPGKEIVVISDPDATAPPEAVQEYDFLFRDSVCLYGWKYRLIQHRYGKLDRYRDAAKIRRETEMIVDISGYTFGSNWGWAANLLAAYRAKCARKLGVPIYYMPQSFGPFAWKGLFGRITERCMKAWLPYAEVLYAREREGYELLKEQYGFRNVRLSEDLVLQNRSIDRTRIYKAEGENASGSVSQETVRILPGSVAILPNVRNDKYGNAEELMQVYRVMIDFWLSAGRHVYLIRHATEDLAFCQRIKAMYEEEERVILLEQDFTCLEYEELVKAFDYLAASRYHAIVHAYKQGIPCIVFGWAEKYKELLGKFSQSAYAVDVRGRIDMQMLTDMIKRMEERYRLESETITSALQKIQRQNAFDCMGYESGAKTIMQTVAEDLCCSCGICAAVCPNGCIHFEKAKGSYLPVIDAEMCVQCGKCLKVCPGYHYEYQQNTHSQMSKQPEGADVCRTDCAEGQEITTAGRQEMQCYSVQVKDHALLRQATSGGFVTGMIRELLHGGVYQAAFLPSGYDYREQMKSTIVRKDDDLEKTQRSRYLPVSQEEAVSYILEHPEEKVIYVGVPCAVHGLCRALRSEGIDRDKILIIGLFCDRTMTYSIYDYMKQRRERDTELTAFHFRDKRAGGWPGNMRLEYADGSHEHLSAKERMIVKDFFRLQRCLYCYDKLNEKADFSVGDNYTGKHAFKEGSNSLIVRTKKARELWEACRELFEVHESSYSEIARSQHLEEKKGQYENNCVYASIHGGRKVEQGLPEDLADILTTEEISVQKKDVRAWKKKKAEISLGERAEYGSIRKRKEAKRLRLYLKALTAGLRG